MSDKSDVNKLRYVLCKSFYSINHGGRSEMKKHIRVSKRKVSMAANASSKNLIIFFEKNHWR
jgi:hypothetical protein